MINDYVKHFSYNELITTLDIIETIKDEYQTKREKEKIALAEMKYKYWLMISQQRNYDHVVLGGN